MIDSTAYFGRIFVVVAERQAEDTSVSCNEQAMWQALVVEWIVTTTGLMVEELVVS